jgi:hypothetical protein
MEADRPLTLTKAEVKNELTYASTPPYKASTEIHLYTAVCRGMLVGSAAVSKYNVSILLLSQRVL